MILDYIPISKSFQAPKCVIKAWDPQLQRISVVALGFLISGPIPKGVLTTNPILEGIPMVEASSSCPITEKKEKEEEEEEEGEIVEVSDSEDDFGVFDQLLSPDASSGDLRQSSPSQSNYHRGPTSPSENMGIQWKQRSTLQELLES